VQDAIRRRKLARGSRLIGLKCGLTSRAKMKQMSVETPCWGFLVDGYAVADGGEIDCKQLIHPKIEPEIVFFMKSPLQGPGCHIGAVLAATDFVMPGMEIIDSRYRDFKFDLKSVVADNCSSSRFVVGGRMASVADLDLRTLGIVMEKNGEPVALGAGAAVLGHPAASVAMLVNMLAARGERLEAGMIVLTGGITEAVAVKPGDAVMLRAQGLGSTSVRFV
jgi:2-oxo-3-hexenedioate decarboxylase